MVTKSGLGRTEANDDELLPLDALGLQPAALAAGAVRRISTFRHDPFKPQFASMRQHRRAIPDYMLAVMKGGSPLGLLEQSCEPVLALDLGRLRLSPGHRDTARQRRRR